MIQGTRSAILKVLVVVTIIIAVDQTLRRRVLLSPGKSVQSIVKYDDILIYFLFAGEVVEKYMVKVGLHIKGRITAVDLFYRGSELNLGLQDFPELVSQHCADQGEEKESRDDKDYYFLIKSQTSGGKNLLLCIPPRMASKQAFQYLSSLYGLPCPGGRLRGCEVRPGFEADNNTVAAVMVRHPFDRLIIEYKHQKHPETEESLDYNSKVPGRQVLFSRHRTGHRRKKNKREFRDFINSRVLSANSSVKSVTQVR